MRLNRVRIVGGPGSGKSFCGAKLSKIFKIPHYDLDDIFWDKKDTDYTLVAPRKVRNKQLKQIVSKKRWIIEGGGSSWTIPSFRKADIILVLKTGRFLRAYRILKRALHARLNIVNRKTETVSGLLGFLKWNHNWEKTHSMKYEAILGNDRRKVKYFKSSDELVSYAEKRR